MDFEQDYVMRMIKDMIRALVQFALNKKVDVYELMEDREDGQTDDLYDRILKMIDEGKINEAENEMLEVLTFDSPQDLELALSFYDHLNRFTDDFLTEHGYTRDEIADGIENAARAYGIEGFEDIYYNGRDGFE